MRRTFFVSGNGQDSVIKLKHRFSVLRELMIVLSKSFFPQKIQLIIVNIEGCFAKLNRLRSVNCPSDNVVSPGAFIKFYSS